VKEIRNKIKSRYDVVEDEDEVVEKIEEGRIEKRDSRKKTEKKKSDKSSTVISKQRMLAYGF
jgi:hypothetical protein